MSADGIARPISNGTMAGRRRMRRFQYSRAREGWQCTLWLILARAPRRPGAVLNAA